MTFATYPSLKDRVVLVTGGGSGIGGCMTEQFAAQGARVAFIDFAEEPSRALVEKLRPGAAHPPLYVNCDLRDIAALRGAVAQISGKLGPIRVLVNNAARDDRHKMADVTPEYWDNCLNLNLRHQFFAIQAVAPGMAEAGGGSVINFSSVSFMRRMPGMVGYTTAKAATIGLTRTMATELGPQAIRVNTIVPGAIRTERQALLWDTPEVTQRYLDNQCLKFRLQPEHVARMALFLAADDSEGCTGQNFFVDAGMV